MLPPSPPPNPGHRFAAFLVELATTPVLVERYRRQPEATMDAAGLSEEQKATLGSGDWKAVCRLLAATSGRPSSGGSPPPRSAKPGAGQLTVIGTGFRAAGQTTPEAVAHLEAADRVFHVGLDPLTRLWLEGRHPVVESLAGCFAEGKPRQDSYREMVERVSAAVRRGERVCWAFYGHPGLFVDAAHEAIRRARRDGFEARMLPGISAEDCLFADLGVDPAVHGWQSWEATDFLLRRRPFDPGSALVLWQIGAIGVTDSRRAVLWSRRGLELLSEALLEKLPAGHRAIVYEASPIAVCEPLRQKVRLGELATAEVTVASTLYVPPIRSRAVDPAMAERLGWPSSTLPTSQGNR